MEEICRSNEPFDPPPPAVELSAVHALGSLFKPHSA